jgi:hypothetical protein
MLGGVSDWVRNGHGNLFIVPQRFRERRAVFYGTFTFLVAGYLSHGNTITLFG